MLSFSFYPFSFSTTSQMAENVAKVQVNNLPRTLNVKQLNGSPRPLPPA
jgi:hypothetical protein